MRYLIVFVLVCFALVGRSQVVISTKAAQYCLQVGDSLAVQKDITVEQGVKIDNLTTANDALNQKVDAFKDRERAFSERDSIRVEQLATEQKTTAFYKKGERNQKTQKNIAIVTGIALLVLSFL
jgi:hypothetical protein